MVSEQERRKSYRLTEKGQAVLLEQLGRLEVMVSNGLQVKKGLRA